MDQQNAFLLKFSICGIHELGAYSACGVTHVLSILDPGFPEPAIFQSFGRHERLELRFHDIIDEREGQFAPTESDVALVLRFGQFIMRCSDPAIHLLVHCHAGISRSTAAMLLLLTQAEPDRAIDQAVTQIANIRPNAWPNLRMIEIGDAMLGHGGQLMAAVRTRYEDMITRFPDFARALIAEGRSREVLSTRAAERLLSHQKIVQQIRP